MLKEVLISSENIKSTLKWNEFYGLFMENPHFKALSDYDRLNTFQDAIFHKESLEQDE